MSTTSKTHSSIDPSNQFNSLPEKERLLTKAKPLSKAGVSGWNKPENLITPERAEQRLKDGKNYGFAAGRGPDDWKLVVFDIEKKGILPEKAQALINEHAVLTWDSVHEGRNRLVKVSPEAYRILDTLATGHDHLSEQPGDDIEIQTTGHAIGPRCEIDHATCSDTKHGCPGSGISEYEFVDGHRYAPVVTKKVVSNILGKLGIDHEKRANSNRQSSPVEVPELAESAGKDIETMEEYMAELQNKNTYAFDDIVQRLKGKEGEKNGLTLTGGYIDRSAVEFVTLSDLYGIAKVIGGEDEASAKRLAYSYHDYFCRETRKTLKNRPRKWLEMNKKYRVGITDAAVKHFDRGRFYRWLKSREKEQTPGLSQRDGSYSKTTRNCVEFAVQVLSFGESDRSILESLAAEYQLELPDGTETHVSEILSEKSGVGTTADRELPTRKEVVQLAKFIDKDHNKKSTYQKALGNLKSEGRLVLAYCKSYSNSEQYVYYQNHRPKPDDADWIEYGGERVSQ